MNTNVWTHTLRARAIKIRAQIDALDDEIVLAHKDGMSWRDIGKAADINHEKARQASVRIAKRDQRKPLPKIGEAEPDGP
jgi:methylase of polypeptide subunit release factors